MNHNSSPLQVEHTLKDVILFKVNFLEAINVLGIHLNLSLKKLVSVISAVLIYSTLPLSAQVQLWGVSDNGGTDGIGTAFNLLDDGTGFTVANNFRNRPDGASPQAGLTAGADGLLYGVTSTGGANGAGTIYSFHNLLGVVKLFDFDQALHGSGARTDLVEIAPGTFVGANSQGGENGIGTLFQFSLQNGLTVLHHFDGAQTGSTPRGNLAYNANTGTIYGSCVNGGSNSFGCIFSYAQGTGLQVLHHFAGDNGGSFPQGGLCLGADSKLYGTTQFGGTQSQGAIFSIEPTGSNYQIIYSLQTQTADGRYPFGALLEAGPGTFLGTCSEGGASGAGTIFSITADGTFTRLRSLVTGSNGSFPKSGLTPSGDGNYYGVCEFGGSNGFGTFYRITPAGVFTKLRDFAYTADGSNPTASILMTPEGDAYTVARNGGTNDRGTLVRYNATNGFQKLHDFALPENGAHPTGMLAAETSFLGLSRAGGDFNAGTFFSLALNGERIKLFDFESDFEGRHPNSELMLHGDGLYYGTARFGGTGSAGTIFSISPEGDFTLLHSFGSSANGQFPHGGLSLGTDGFFYGTTISGGTFGNGTVFKVSSEGEFTKLFDLFSFFHGSSPQGSLVLTASGTFLGVASGGGDFGSGTLFEFNPANNDLTVLHSFNGGSDGNTPQHGLLAQPGGIYYGTCSFGGNGGGTLWRYESTAGLSVVHIFAPPIDGAEPSGPLVGDEDGNVYGYCYGGGAQGVGSAFMYNAGDGFSKIYDFNPSLSANPQGGPVLFFPECLIDDACPSADVCIAGVCDFGLCTEVPILSSIAVVSQGECIPETDSFTLTLQVALGANPGGNLIIGNQSFDLSEFELNFPLVLNLPSTGAPVVLNYSFDATGCSGTTEVLGTAPMPCPPATIHVTLDLGGFQPGAQGLFVGGSWQNWNAAMNPMTQVDSETWEITLGVPEGVHEFNFFDGPNLFNAEYVIGACAVNGKRSFTIEETNAPVFYCWSSCASNCSLGSTFLAKDELQTWPNPVKQGENIHLRIPVQSQHMTYRVVDMFGKTVQSGQIPLSGEFQISTAGYARAMYTCLIMNNDGSALRGVSRVVVQ